jgi:hypothetical protein
MADMTIPWHTKSRAATWTENMVSACGREAIGAWTGRRPRVKTPAQVIAELDRLYSLGWHRQVLLLQLS